MPASKSPAKLLQEVTEQPPATERVLRLCVRTDVGYEYHLSMVESAAKALIDPDVADTFIQVPVPADQGSVRRRYLHTSRIKEVDMLDDFSVDAEGDVSAPVRKSG